MEIGEAELEPPLPLLASSPHPPPRFLRHLKLLYYKSVELVKPVYAWSAD